jgi:hypothetical protein
MSWNFQGSVFSGIFKALNTLGSVSAHEVRVLPGTSTVGPKKVEIFWAHPFQCPE